MTTQIMKNNSSQPSGWSLKDTIWMFGVYGATVGAGTLFLPVEIGTRGPLVFLMLLLLCIPLSIVPHVLICRVFMRDHHDEDNSLPLFGAFFKDKGIKIIRMYFCIAHYPVTLVYCISLVNTLDNLITVHLHLPIINRAFLSFIVVAGLYLALSRGRDKVVNILGAMALPFSVAILIIAFIQIPDWRMANFTGGLKATNDFSAGEIINSIWMTLPLVTFSLCSAPLLSPLASHYREAGNGGEAKSVFVIRAAYTLICFSIIFFVLSCLLSNPQETFISAKAHNLNILSVMEGHGGFNIMYSIAPVIAIIGMTKSFLGVSLSVAETFSELMSQAFSSSRNSEKKKGKWSAFLIMSTVSFVVVYLNPDVIDLIEIVCGPMIAIFLFLIPAYLIYTRESLRGLRGISSLIVMAGGILTVSALFYSMI